ncbi:hypothetical protein ACS0TY_031938 [Phlomoides rotata]
MLLFEIKILYIGESSRRHNFEGNIPESITHLILLRLLNLSHNSVNNNIPPEIRRMKGLEQLGLSSNRLTGGIPQTLASLTVLEVLDLSHNHLDQSHRVISFQHFQMTHMLATQDYVDPR